MKKRRQQKGRFFRPKDLRKPKPEKPRVPAYAFAALKAAGLKIKPQSFLENPGLSRQQGLKRFAGLSIKENKALVGQIAAEYAKIFNAGFTADSVGLETYYKGIDGSETFCFADLRKVRIAPKKLLPSDRGDSLLIRMKQFYCSISMNDYEARAFFVESFSEKLSNKLKQAFREAIKSAFRKTT